MVRSITPARKLNEDIRHLFDALKNEPPLPCVLIASAFVEKSIRVLLRGFLIEEDKPTEEMFDGNGPLSSFDNCAKMAYCLGLISESTFDNIQLIRRIRNAFAHTHIAINFEDEQIKALCRNLKKTDFGSVPIPFTDEVTKSDWNKLESRDR